MTERLTRLNPSKTGMALTPNTTAFNVTGITGTTGFSKGILLRALIGEAQSVFVDGCMVEGDEASNATHTIKPGLES